MPRVAGTDPGTTSLDLLVLEDGTVADQYRIPAADLLADPERPVRWLRERGPFDLVAGPSGYGLPLKAARDCTKADLALLSLVRPDDRNRQGVPGFGRVVRRLLASDLPVVFLPGVIHLPTVPAHRKTNRIDLGTPDKLCVAALALERHAARTGAGFDACNLCVVELGSAFSACLVLAGGRVVDGTGGTGGPVGWQAHGAWDGEAAYLLSPLGKEDLFTGGVTSQPDTGLARTCFRESLLRAVAGLHAVTPFGQIVLSGRLTETEPAFTADVAADLDRFGPVRPIESLPGAWVKHAAQGAALLADGLAGGSHAPLVAHLALRAAAGTALDSLSHPRAAAIKTVLSAEC